MGLPSPIPRHAHIQHTPSAHCRLPDSWPEVLSQSQGERGRWMDVPAPSPSGGPQPRLLTPFCLPFLLGISSQINHFHSHLYLSIPFKVGGRPILPTFPAFKIPSLRLGSRIPGIPALEKPPGRRDLPDGWVTCRHRGSPMEGPASVRSDGLVSLLTLMPY